MFDRREDVSSTAFPFKEEQIDRFTSEEWITMYGFN